ncbi:hypothetical protein D3C80_1187150 [compost metagenome]
MDKLKAAYMSGEAHTPSSPFSVSRVKNRAAPGEPAVLAMIAKDSIIIIGTTIEFSFMTPSIPLPSSRYVAISVIHNPIW